MYTQNTRNFKLLIKVAYLPKTNCFRIYASDDSNLLRDEETIKRLNVNTAKYTGSDIETTNAYTLFPKLVDAVKRAADEFRTEKYVLYIPESVFMKIAKTVGEYDDDAWQLLKWEYNCLQVDD